MLATMLATALFASAPCLVLLVAVFERLVAPSYAVPSPETSAVLVTGASTGIGRHAAEELKKLGFRAAGRWVLDVAIGHIIYISSIYILYISSISN